MGQLTFEQVSELLATCKKETLADFAFGDSEVDWHKDGKYVASGYFSTKRAYVMSYKDAVETFSFEGDQARQLQDKGIKGKFQRNDAGENRG